MNRNKNTKRYGNRVFAVNESITDDTRITGLNNNDLIIGTSGTGKTGGYVIPALQNVSGSLVVSDTKGQLYKHFGEELKGKGYNVVVLDFTDPSKSCGYNPLRYVRRRKNGSINEQDVLTISRVLSPMMTKDDPIWDMCAAGYIAFLISFCLEADAPEVHNMANVCETRRRFSQRNGELLFEGWVENHPSSFAAKKYYELLANRKAEKMWSSIEGFVSSHLEIFNCSDMDDIFNREDDFDLNRLGTEKTVIFVNQSDRDRAFDKVINLFHTQVLQTMCTQADANPDGRLKVPVRMILDDFASGSTIPDFDKVISVIRSRDISVSLIIQSLTQLETLYDHPTSITIVNNCDNILFLGGQDRETAEYIAYRAIKTTESVLMMPRDSAYLIRSGERAKLVKKIVPYSTCKDFEAGDAG